MSCFGVQVSLQSCINICTLGSEYLPRPSASGNIPTLGAIFIDIPRGRVEHL